jgi:hypothetical protein
MKGMLIPLLFALALLAGSYGLMVGAIRLPVTANSAPVPAGNIEVTIGSKDSKPDADDKAPFSREAMEQVIDCYAGKPVYLDAQKLHPLYPPCERLLRIYQGNTTDPEAVLALLANQDKEDSHVKSTISD